MRLQIPLTRLIRPLRRVVYRFLWAKLPSKWRVVLGKIAFVLLLLAVVVHFFPLHISDVEVPVARAGQSKDLPSANGVPESISLTVCSQNLHRFSSKEKSNKLKRSKQKKFLITRMKDAECDVIALQEVVGSRREDALEVAVELAGALGKRTKREFRAFVGRSKDKYISNGFLVAEDAGVVEEVRSHWRERLPKLQLLGPSSRFTRGPLSLVFRQENKPPLILLTFHLKSRHKGWKDHSRTDFEGLRMQEAAGIKRIVRSLRTTYGKEVEVIAVGDRNSGAQSAAADILRGVRTLSDFDSNKGCRLTEQETSICVGNPPDTANMIDLFGLRQRENPEKYVKGSYRYRGKESVIDEILVTPGLLKKVRRSDGTIAIGFKGQFRKGSDHKLVWVDLRR